MASTYYRPFVLISFLLITLTTSAQEKKDTIMSAGIPFVRFQFSFLAPSGDFENRFGNSSEVGGAFGYKTKSNWQFEIEAGYHFGKQVKVQGLLTDVINSAGDATDADGELVKLTYQLRGLSFFANVGKLFPLDKYNRNSGILIQFGAGYLQHKIKIDYRDGEVFQLSEERLKGYDRLHTGFAIKQFIGYQHFGKSNLMNFYVGFEMKEAFTKNRRKYNYDTQAFDLDPKTDILYGVRLGWMIPFRSRTADDFYYY